MAPTSATCTAFSLAMSFCPCESACEPACSLPQPKALIPSGECSGLGISGSSCHSFEKWSLFGLHVLFPRRSFDVESVCQSPDL